MPMLIPWLRYSLMKRAKFGSVGSKVGILLNEHVGALLSDLVWS